MNDPGAQSIPYTPFCPTPHPPRFPPDPLSPPHKLPPHLSPCPAIRSNSSCATLRLQRYMQRVVGHLTATCLREASSSSTEMLPSLFLSAGVGRRGNAEGVEGTPDQGGLELLHRDAAIIFLICGGGRREQKHTHTSEHDRPSQRRGGCIPYCDHPPPPRTHHQSEPSFAPFLSPKWWNAARSAIPLDAAPPRHTHHSTAQHLTPPSPKWWNAAHSAITLGAAPPRHTHHSTAQHLIPPSPKWWNAARSAVPLVRTKAEKALKPTSRPPGPLLPTMAETKLVA